MFKQLAHLKEEHHKHGFGKLMTGIGQKANAQCAQCGNSHEKIFVKHLAMSYVFGTFENHVIANDEIGHEIHQ